jgi:hypothetical protein
LLRILFELYNADGTILAARPACTAHLHILLLWLLRFEEKD